MSRLLKPLPEDVRQMIRAFASDRVGPYWESTAPLINGLQFSQQERVDYPRYYPIRTRVECDVRKEYFMKKDWLSANDEWTPSHMLEFSHEQFDERNFPWQFHPRLKWKNSREQDEIEAMGAEDTRLYPDGMPASVPPPWWWWSATSQEAPVVQPLQWSREGEGKWVSQPVLSPP